MARVAAALHPGGVPLAEWATGPRPAVIAIAARPAEVAEAAAGPPGEADPVAAVAVAVADGAKTLLQSDYENSSV